MKQRWGAIHVIELLIIQARAYLGPVFLPYGAFWDLQHMLSHRPRPSRRSLVKLRRRSFENRDVSTEKPVPPS